MATTREHDDRIVETATEARQAEPGPSVLALLDRLDRACDPDPGHHLVRVLPHLSGAVRHARLDSRMSGNLPTRPPGDQTGPFGFQPRLYPVKSCRIERRVSRVMRRSVHRKTIVKKK